MFLLYSHIFSCFITVNTLFLLFSFLTVESTFKMASIQFNSVSLCVTTLTVLLTWTVIELHMGFSSLGRLNIRKRNLCASALVSLSDVQPPSVHKSHILNEQINKLYIWMETSTWKTNIIHKCFHVSRIRVSQTPQNFDWIFYCNFQVMVYFNNLRKIVAIATFAYTILLLWIMFIYFIYLHCHLLNNDG